MCARKRHISRAIIQLPPIRIGPTPHAAICALIRESYKLEPPRAGWREGTGRGSRSAAAATAPADI